MGELLHTPGSTLTLPTVYHPHRKFTGMVCGTKVGGKDREARDAAETERFTGPALAVIGWRVAMPDDLVPDLLARATEVLEREFDALPAFEPARASDADSGAIAQVLEETERRQ